MFANLIESGPRSERRATQGIISLCFHLAVGVGAVEASRRVVVAEPEGPRVDTTLFVLPERPRVETAPAAPTAPGPVGPSDPIVIAAPVVDPVGIPPIEAGPAIDPRRFVLAPVAPPCAECGGSGPPAATVFTEATVDEPVAVVSQPAPEFPLLLRTAGVAGVATIEFVVDTAGLVEAGSIRVLDATHPSFGESARTAIERSRFRPATVKGLPVRQLVRQAVRFRIG
ncbi:MAG: TonB family protein [Gemmatimonadetes bacterium]|nr:TonB family protein [Gemmatimonadota bacterium]